MRQILAAFVGLSLVGAAAASERIRVAAGQPLCIDEESLAALITAAVAKQPLPSVACQFLKGGESAEVVERMPSGLPNVREIKVRVTPRDGRPVTGYTFEIDQD